jgi:hypothetical protein
VVVGVVVAVVCDWVVVVLPPCPGEVVDVAHALWALLDQHGGEDWARPGTSAAVTTPAAISATAPAGIATRCIPPAIGSGGRISRHSKGGYAHRFPARWAPPLRYRSATGDKRLIVVITEELLDLCAF